MKILLFGKNGQLGNELLKRFKITNAFSKEELDITNLVALQKVFKKHKPDIVINAAAYHVVPDCETNPEKAFLVNAIAVKYLAELAEQYKSKFVYFSTDYIFDGLKRKPYSEDDKPNPLQMYGISKVAGEYAALTYCQKSIVIRTAYLYGGKHGSRAKKGNFVLTILQQAVGKRNLEVSSDQIVSPTYAVDLAEATYQLLQHPEAKGVYHLVNKGKCSLAEFAQEILKTKKIETKIIPVDRKGMSGMLHRPVYSVLTNTKAAKLGINLPPWQNALKRYILSFT